MTLPKQPIKMKDGLIAYFRDYRGQPLDCIRFEDTSAKPAKYIGYIDSSEKVKLKKLKAVVDYMLELE